MTASITLLSPHIATAGAWSPEECLADLLDSIQDGTINPSRIVIIYTESGKMPEYYVAGPGSALDQIGMVQLFLHRYLHDVSGDTCQPY